jgi:ABC-type transport system involved in multi-copper enzyme maturation permease subunit
MSTIWTIATLTAREAVRRRLVAAFAVIAVALIAISGWGFARLSHNGGLTSGETSAGLPEAFILFMFMFSFVVALSASAIAAPAVSGEVDSGVLATVLTRPVRRSEVLLGKWLGLAGLLTAYTGLVCGLQVAVVAWTSGFVPPDPAGAAALVLAEGLTLLTLVLLLSTRLSALAAGVLGVALFGIAWLAGVVGALGQAFRVPALHTASEVTSYLLPTDGLWHGAIFCLEPSWLVSRRLVGGLGNPFFSQTGAGWSYLAWAAVWLLAVLALGVISFERREL